MPNPIPVPEPERGPQRVFVASERQDAPLRAPFTVLLRPRSAVIEQHLGIMAFHNGGAASQKPSTHTPDVSGNPSDHTTLAPPVCLMTFSQSIWQPHDASLTRFLGGVVRWAAGQSMLPPTRWFEPGVGRGFPTRNQPGVVSPSREADVFMPRALWVLIRDATSSFIVTVNDRNHQIVLQPCPSIRSDVATGSWDAASSWLPRDWFTSHGLALTRSLRGLDPPSFQSCLDFG